MIPFPSNLPPSLGTNWNAPLIFLTDNTERMRLTPAGFLGLGTPAPQSMFHISDGDASMGGVRNWMRFGTLATAGTDNMYMGLKREGNDRYDAVINWGDNPFVNNEGPDALRFIFTAPPSFGTQSSGTHGLEVARFNSNSAHMGIGNFYSLNANPTRRLEVMDQANRPQFRITHTFGNRFTDFRTSANGYLNIAPSNGRVGISQATFFNPTHTLDVGGQARIRTINQNDNLTRISGRQ